MKLRPYQEQIVEEAITLIKRNKFVYLAMQVRTGKTLTSLAICDRLGVKNVLFVTKKKAIGSITEDVSVVDRGYNTVVTNYESLHKVTTRFDVIIIDEAHRIGAFPKPNIAAKWFKKLSYKPIYILMSGTPTPESYSQMYHQTYFIEGSPFYRFSNFYRFAHDFVDIKERKINSFLVKDYNHGRESIINFMKPYTINYTQEEAGFKSVINEHILNVRMMDDTYAVINKLKKDLVYELDFVGETILADTPVKLLSKMHQLYSGTIKFESGDSCVIDFTKADFIYNEFYGKKIGIFYKFKEELNAIKSVFMDQITEDIEEFKNTDKSIALQIVSGREGISLKEADAIVYYNIDFSATSYWQSRDRMTTIDRKESNIYWIFSVGGIENDIFNTVKKKKNYTINHFKKNLL